MSHRTTVPLSLIHIFTCEGAGKILYTTDGTDPRYSKTAQVYAAALGAIAAGTTVKAVAYAEGKFPSDLAELVA